MAAELLHWAIFGSIPEDRSNLAPDAASGRSVVRVSDREKSTAHSRVWKVGALAELTGLTVRALHHYDHIGLLKPSHRSPTGHRLYTGDDVARLYQICLLRRLGFALSRIGEVLEDPHWQLRDAVVCHLDDTRRRVAVATSLQSRLSKMATSLTDSMDDPSTEELFATIEEMTMLDSTVHSTTALLCMTTSRLRTNIWCECSASPPGHSIRTVRDGVSMVKCLPAIT